MIIHLAHRVSRYKCISFRKVMKMQTIQLPQTYSTNQSSSQTLINPAKDPPASLYCLAVPINLKNNTLVRDGAPDVGYCIHTHHPLSV